MMMASHQAPYVVCGKCLTEMFGVIIKRQI